MSVSPPQPPSGVPPGASSGGTPRSGTPFHVRRRLRRLLGHFVPEFVWYNWRIDTITGIAAGIYQGCIWTFALQIARGKLHATGTQMGIATAAPAVGYLFSILWARQMEGRGKMPFITVTWMLSRGLFLLTPLLVRGSGSRGMLILLISMAPIIFSISTPAYTSIMKDIYPDELRGRLMSYVRIAMAAAMLLTARLMGWWQEHGHLDFRWMFAIGGVFGVYTAYAFTQLRLTESPPVSTPPPIGTFLRQTFGILIYNKGFRWFTMSVIITGFGNLVASTYYPIYQVDHFSITPTQIATMQNIGGILSMFSLFFWGWYLDRFGSLATVLVAVLLNCLAPLFYAVGTDISWLYAAATVIAVSGYGVDLGYLNTTLMFAEPGRAAQYQAVHSTFFGLRGTIAPLVAMPLLHLLGGSWRTAFLLCVSVIGIGIVFQVFSLQSYRRIQRQDLLSHRD